MKVIRTFPRSMHFAANCMPANWVAETRITWKDA